MLSVGYRMSHVVFYEQKDVKNSIILVNVPMTDIQDARNRPDYMRQKKISFMCFNYYYTNTHRIQCVKCRVVSHTAVLARVSLVLKSTYIKYNEDIIYQILHMQVRVGL
jgi:hypothetical protein